jgi:hypothetical protein
MQACSKFDMSHQAKISEPCNVPHHRYAGTDRRTGSQAASSIERTLTTRTPPHPPAKFGQASPGPCPHPLARNRWATSADSSVAQQNFHAWLPCRSSPIQRSEFVRPCFGWPLATREAWVGARTSQPMAMPTAYHANLDFLHWGCRRRLKEGNHERPLGHWIWILDAGTALVASDPLMEIHFPSEKPTSLSLYYCALLALTLATVACSRR